jgi:hypothetical protein
MGDGHNGWEARLPILKPEQKQHVLQWLQEEEQTWAKREEEWINARVEMLREIEPSS